MTTLKFATKVQKEELSEKESDLMVKGKEMEKLQKLNRVLTNQYAKLKCEKNALDTKVQNVSTNLYMCEGY